MITEVKTFLTNPHSKPNDDDDEIPHFETVVLQCSNDISMNAIDECDASSNGSSKDDKPLKPRPIKSSIVDTELLRSTRKNRQKVYTDEQNDSGSENEKRPKRERRTIVEKEKDREKDKQKEKTSIPLMVEYKKSGQQFLQATDCTKLGKNTVGKCRECMDAADDGSYTYCRFYKYRKLR